MNILNIESRTKFFVQILVGLFFLFGWFSAKSQSDDIRVFELAPKPPLGWNSFNSYGAYLYEEAAYKNLDAFVEKLKPHGYQYFVIDVGWYGEFNLIHGTKYSSEKHAREIALDDFGRPEPSKTYFPNGIKPIIDKAHQLGVKFGIHMMRGIPRKAYELNLPIEGTNYRARDIADTTSICSWNHQNYGVNMDKSGAQEYYNSIYQKLADWGVDFLKVDDLIPYPKELIGIIKAIRKTQRPILISLSPGGNTNLKDLPYYSGANMLRITADIWDDQVSIDRSFIAWESWQGKGRPGFWPDLDMIPFGQLQLMSPPQYQTNLVDPKLSGKGTTRMSELTPAQMRTFITQRALSASPLMMGGDLISLGGYALELITNQNMLACNQNGYTGTLIKKDDGIEIWGTCVPEIKIRGWIGIFNRSEEEKSIQLSKDYLEIKNYFFYEESRENPKASTMTGQFIIKDIWNDKNYFVNEDVVELKISPDDVLFLYYEQK